ncbi:hypothetical protein [Pantoea ananatis]|uniref:hypothetical protein n=1 Tax=Pantoea ananas TaxID=553 RepID=UPI000A65274C|nr:hypothetical protein [Pantoea ananatis]
MNDKNFHEIYKQLSASQTSDADCCSVIEELTRLCLETISKSSVQECLAAADPCFSEIGHSERLFTLAMTRWITVDECLGLAKKLENEESAKHFQAKSSVAYNLSSTDESRSMLTACRLCVLPASPAVSLGWTLSLATSFPTSINVLKTVQTLLLHHMKEYPLTTLRLLSSPDSPFASVQLAQETLRQLEQQQSNLNTLPRIREFLMPPEMRLIYASLKRSENRDIQRHADEKSIMSMFFTKHFFKYANKTAIEFQTGNDVRETSLEMTSFHVEAELPVTWLTDPISANFEMMRLWEGDLQ